MNKLEEAIEQVPYSEQKSDDDWFCDPQAMEWPDPLPLPKRSLPRVPDLPEDLIPASLQEGLKDIAWRMQVAREAVTIALIVTIGSLIGSNCRVRPKQHDDWSVVPNLWGLLIDRPGKLKSSALEAACTRVLASLAEQASTKFDEQSKKYEAQIAAHQAQKSALRESMKDSVKTQLKKGKATEESKEEQSKNEREQ